MWKQTLVACYAVLTGVLMIATALEHVRGTAFILDTVYRSSWFLILWLILAISGTVYAWKMRLGRRVALLGLHLSFLMMLTGCLFTRFWGIRGMVHLRAGEPVSQFMELPDRTFRNFPFELELDTFRIAVYPGTQTPKDYVSELSCRMDTSEFDGVVSMNRVWTVSGYRLCQSSFDEDGRGVWLGVNHDPWGIFLVYLGYACAGLSFIFYLFGCSARFMRLLRHPLLFRAGLVLLLVAHIEPLEARRSVSVLSRVEADSLRTRQVVYQDRVVPFHTLAHDFVVKLTGRPDYLHLTPEQVVGSWLLYPDEWQYEPMILVEEEKLCRALGLSGPYVALADLFEGNVYLPERLMRREQTLHRQETGAPSGSLEQAILKLDERVGLILMLQRGSLIQPLPADGSLERLSPFRVQAELFYQDIPFARWLFPVLLTLGLVAFFFLMYAYVRPVRPSSIWHKGWQFLNVVASLAAVFHLLGYSLRWYIGGRIPLSNGYETLFFLGGCLLWLGLLLGRRIYLMFPAGVLLSGFAFLVAHLGDSDPQITSLMPVLHSSWLSIHVSLVMISYALFALMMLGGVLALLFRRRKRVVLQLYLLSRLMLYPAVFCLGLGIVFGSVWANVSWGSYWAWDPKEVWALITLLIYGAAFHDQSIRLFRRPLFFHAYQVLAFTAVVMTYWGVNYVLGGMHSYAG